MCAASLNKASEHVRACSKFRAEREINKDKQRKLQKIKLHVTSFRVLFFLDFDGKFLFVCHKSHTTSHPGFKIGEIVTGVHRLFMLTLILPG